MIRLTKAEDLLRSELLGQCVIISRTMDHPNQKGRLIIEMVSGGMQFLQCAWHDAPGGGTDVVQVNFKNGKSALIRKDLVYDIAILDEVDQVTYKLTGKLPEF